MIIKSLELSNFRNYENLNITFDEGTNILFGDNAQGKTNILESIYLCATTKSHKGSKDKEIILEEVKLAINEGKEEMRVFSWRSRRDSNFTSYLLPSTASRYFVRFTGFFKHSSCRI